MSTRTVASYCRMCPAMCGVEVTVEGGRVTRLRGDHADPLSRGYVCPKGRKMAALPDDPARLDRPLVRDGRGELVPVDWGTALDDLASRLAAIVDEAGPYAVGMYTGTMFDGAGRWAGARFMGALGSPSTYTSLTIDSVAKVYVTGLMAGRERVWPNTDWDTTTLLLVFGENMVVSHGAHSYVPDPVRYLRSVTGRGEAWVFDPRRTETARLATRHLVPRSGTDFAVLAHLVREVLDDGADEEYLAAHARNVDELRRVVAPFDGEATARLTGIAAADLAAVVAAVRRHRRVAVATGTGVSMAATGNVAEWMAFALQVVTGSFGRPGGRWFNHGAAFDPSNLAPEPGPAPGPRTRPDIPRTAGQYPSALLAGEVEAGHVRALLVNGGNPMTAFPQPSRLGAALDTLDVLAVWDLVPTATTAHATHVFPGLDPLERPDLKVPLHLPTVSAQYTPAVVPPRGDRRAMWWSFAALARRMGLSILPGGAGPDGAGPDGARPGEWSDDDVLALQVAGTPVDWEAVRASPGPVPYPRRDDWVEDVVLPGGRWDLAPEPLVPRMAEALARPAHDLVLGNRREVQHTNSQLTWDVGGAAAPRPYVYANPADAESAGATDGAPVEVTSPHGSVQGTLRVDDAVARGTVAVPHGFAEPNVGHLTATDTDLDPLTGMPVLVGVPVTLRPAP